MTSEVPLVSVIIPALDEVDDIGGCLEAVAAQALQADALEVILVDGCSSDATVDAARCAAATLGLALHVVENPRRRTSISLNRGLESARGRFVVRLDARSRIQPGYVATTTGILDREGTIGVVGGSQVPVARSARLIDRSIVRALSNRYTTGLSRYRRSSSSGPSDTVWMGVFRTEELRHLGGWDPDFGINEDWDLNRRFRLHGLGVWFEAGLDSGYVPRATLHKLARQYFGYGRAKGRWWVRGQRPALRQLALVAVPPTFVFLLWRLSRRVGAAGWLLAPAGLLVADAVGAREPPIDAAERTGSAAVIATYSAAWWAGVLSGAIEELLDFRDRPA